MDETWDAIPGFPHYTISNFGRVFNLRRNSFMRPSKTQFGDMKILLTEDGNRYTRSLRVLVASTFLERPDERCNTVIMLDGDKENVRTDNLAWRPRWFALTYARQFGYVKEVDDPVLVVPIRNIQTGVEYKCIWDAAMTEGLLFDDIWRSMRYRGQIYPSSCSYELIETLRK